MLLTTKEIALKWGVSVTWVTVLCKKGRIEGAIREGNRWYIPEDAKKPEDKRSCKNAPAKARFRFIDLFAGVGGFHQAMRYLGGECVMAAEVNEECKKTYRLNYHTEEKEIRGDVREIDPTTIAPFDVLCAGFPCQPFSKAGAQRGFQDKTRGNLFYTIMDILDAHPEVKFVILENVRNLADKTENWDIITSELTQRNFYITEEPIILSPSDFGIPQIRERVYILGIRKDIRNEKILSNAYGMDFHDFQRAIMLDSPPRRKSRSEFGMGLKTAACWFGKCWSVESVALGSGIKYRTTVDVEALSKYKNEEITVEEIPCSKKEHGTIVTIWNLNRTLSGTQIGKTKDQLRGMYRTDLRSGEIKILYNGVGLVYETPKVLTEVLPDGSEKVWKKNIDISFDFNGESKRIYGFVGLLDEGSTSGAGFTLIRYGRVIVGGYENGYRPEEIFEKSNSYDRERVCAPGGYGS